MAEFIPSKMHPIRATAVNSPLRVVIAALGLLVFGGSAIAQQKYVVTLGNMTAWRIVSNKHIATNQDTDFISLSVEATNQPKFKKGYGPNNLRTNQTTNLALSSGPILVAGPTSTLTIGWAAVNSGTGQTQQLISRLNDTAEQIGESVPNVYSQVISFIAGHVVGFLTANCNCPLFGGKVTFSGAQLASGALGPQWPSEGPGRWHAVFDFPNIPGGCSTGHYNLEIHIQKVP